MTARTERDPVVQETARELNDLTAHVLLEMRKDPAAAFLTDQALAGLAGRAAAAAAAWVWREVSEQVPPQRLAKPLRFCGGCGQPVELGSAGSFTLHKPGCKGARA